MLCRTGCSKRQNSEICCGSLLCGILPVAKAGSDLLAGA
jgi:hypothetical protein